MYLCILPNLLNGSIENFEPITNKFEKNGVFANETGLNAMGEGTSRAHAFRTDTEESAEQ
jgi:hypothetical protein